MKRRWKIIIGVGIFALLVSASLTITMRVQPAREVDAYKKFLRDKGEKLEFSEVLPPPASPEENSADSVRVAFSLIGPGFENVPYAMELVAPGRALIGARQPDARDAEFTNTWEEFAATVEADRSAIDLLHQVLNRPKLDFHLDYTKGYETALNHLAPMKHSVQVLTSAVIYQIHIEDTAAATTNILTMLSMIQRDFRDEMLISHLVRVAMTTMAVVPTWELLQATNVTGSQLVTLRNGWQKLEFLKDAETACEIERADTDMIIERTRDSHQEYRKLLGFTSGGLGAATPWPQMLDDATAGVRATIGETLWRSSWSYSTELNMLRVHQDVLEALRAMQTNRTQFYKTNYDILSARLSTIGNTNSVLCDALKIADFREFFPTQIEGSFVRKTLKAETTRRIVVTAIALKRYHIKHGALPAALGELVPDFLVSVPVDPFDGRPLKYRSNPDETFLLYSVGEDGIDDGGDATPVKTPLSGNPNGNWLTGRDWVWPQPATAAEIQYFYEHPPK